jgi:hypothetical protein
VRMKRSSLCSVSRNISAPCETCKKPAAPVHIVYADFSIDEVTKFYCEEHCPEHGGLLFAA